MKQTSLSFFDVGLGSETQYSWERHWVENTEIRESAIDNAKLFVLIKQGPRDSLPLYQSNTPAHNQGSKESRRKSNDLVEVG